MRTYSRNNLFWGLILIVLGLGFLADSLNFGDFATLIFKFWPAILLLIGLVDLIEGKYRSAIFWLVIGGLFQLNSLDIIEVNFWSLFWPVVLILIGSSILLRQETGATRDDKQTVSSVSIFGGDERKAESKTFKGANITAIFGGSKLDLRSTDIDKEGAVIDALVLFGGSEIILPKDTNIKSNVFAMFGGTDDKRSNKEIDDSKPVVKICGTVLFGGIEIKD